MFQNDAITSFHELIGPSTFDVTTSNGPHTILGVAMQQSNTSSNTVVKCGNDIIAKNYATNFSNVPMNYQCNDDIIISKTGNDDASVIVTYVPYLTGAYSTTTQFGYNPTANIASSSDVQVFGSISAGEIVIVAVLMIGLLLKCMELLARGISSIKINRDFLGYSGGDVPVDSQ